MTPTSFPRRYRCAVFLLMALLCVAPAAARSHPKRILFIGDSVTDGGWGRSNGTMMPSSERNHTDLNHIYGHSYMYLCAAELERRFPERNYAFFNRGISGNTLEKMAARWEEDALALQPDLISVLIGINDVSECLKQKEKTFDFDAWERRYRNLLDDCRRQNPQIRLVLCTPFSLPVGKLENEENQEVRREMLEHLAEIIQNIAQDYGAVCLRYDRYFPKWQDSPRTPSETYWIWDGIHPTPAGHAAMARIWLRSLKRKSWL